MSLPDTSNSNNCITVIEVSETAKCVTQYSNINHKYVCNY